MSARHGGRWIRRTAAAAGLALLAGGSALVGAVARPGDRLGGAEDLAEVPALGVRDEPEALDEVGGAGVHALTLLCPGPALPGLVFRRPRRDDRPDPRGA